MASLNTVALTPSGALADDRRFAIIDGFGHYVNGKRNARVHLLRSSFDPCSQTLTVGGDSEHEERSFHVDRDRHALELWLSNFFGIPVEFQENTNAGFPDDTDSPGPTLVSTATLCEVAQWFNLTLDQARARFRANLEIDGVPPFWEDQLFGLRGTTVRFKIGEVIFDGVNPCQRCIVPARDQTTGENIPDFAKRFVEMRKKHFPEWAEPSRFNHFYRLAINTRLADGRPNLTLNVGEPLEIIGTQGTPEPITLPSAAKRPSRWSGSLRVDCVYDNTPSVRTFRLTSTDEAHLPFTYMPGQFLNVALTVDGAVQRRCYTISSTPTRPHYCEITVKREETGTVSRFLHEHVREGMNIEASGPGGKFTFTEDDADALLLIGAGVGITPLMSKIRYLTDINWHGQISLLYCARAEQDIIFRDELMALQKKFRRLNVTTTLTRETGPTWNGLRGRITPELLCKVLPVENNRRIHICGPIEMADEVTNMLKVIGVSPEQIHSEAFGGAAKTLVPSNNNASIIGTATFTDSGKSEPIHLGQSILEAASLVGISVDRGCMEGICGRCKVRLLSGEVTMAVEEALSDSDKVDGYVLACQAKPTGNVAVDI